MSLFKSLIHLIKNISCLPSTRNWKDTNESNLKAIEGSRNIYLGQLDYLHQINDKDILDLCKLNQNFTMFQRGTMKQGSRESQVHQLNVPIRRQQLWIIGLSNAIFSNNGQYFCNIHLNGLNIEILCILMFFKILKTFFPLSPLTQLILYAFLES